MISVAKPDSPAKLADGVDLNMANCAAFLANRHDYEAGRASFTIETKIYGHAAVKNVLRAAQHDKCCYCEGRFAANAAGDVEHFRPKKYSQQRKKQPRVYPGYYWLGYEWSNLYFACQVCNRSKKKNFFPLRDPASRVRDHLGDITAEEPLLIDPGVVDPRDHIRFREDVAVGMTDCGEETVAVLDLNRDDLVEERLERCNIIRSMQVVVAKFGASTDLDDQTLVADARTYLGNCVTPAAKFSAMASDLVNGTGVA